MASTRQRSVPTPQANVEGDKAGSNVTEYIMLTPTGIKNLSVYKYVGVDLSYYYNYFASPLAQTLTDRFVPLWMAPNTITVCAFMFTLIPHLLFLNETPTQSESLPRWLCLTLAICTLVYQTLDNMDGKQARRTKTSSPLGQILDHGCDSLTISMLNLSLAYLNRVDLRSKVGGLQFACTLIAFYMTIWEEFHTHRFTLPVFNGPNEGIVIAVAQFLIAGILGEHVLHGVVRTVVLVFFFVAAFVTIISHLYRTLTTTHRNPRPFDRAAPKTNALIRLIPVLVLAGYVMIMCEFIHPKRIASTLLFDFFHFFKMFCLIFLGLLSFVFC
jgi:phosphatidylglycerophosphate synthase